MVEPKSCFNCGKVGQEYSAPNAKWCTECQPSRKKIWNRNNPEAVKKHKHDNNLKTYRQRRNAIMDLLGRECVCCGETIEVFLTVDHIHGGGNKQRKELGTTSSDAFYRWMLKQPVEQLLKDFQTLCFNCNHGKHRMGVCPHIKEDK